MTNKLYKIDWLEFEIRNKDKEKAFEDLCYFLFCRKFKKISGSFGYRNQTGIEKEPIIFKEKYIGFQSKYFENKIKWQKLKESIEKANNKNKNLDIIWFFINKEFSESSDPKKKKSKKQVEVEKYAKSMGVKIFWYIPSNFEIELNNSKNLDLTQLYFGIGDDFGFLNENTNPEVNTFLQSSDYIDLPVIDDNNKKVIKLDEDILQKKGKIYLISGHPGSGKSILTYYLFGKLSGLTEDDQSKSLKVIESNKARPMRIDLKLCANNALEEIIRGRQNDYNLRNDNIGFIYLFDGLDELGEEKAKQVFDYTDYLLQNKLTKKIIFSCRTGNSNRIRIKSHFKDVEEYKVNKLDSGYIKKYFKNKSDSSKESKLNLILKNNSSLIKEINDILLIKLLWETIDSVNENTSIFGLISKKIDILLNSVLHQKDLTYLNLLNEKKDEIIKLNKIIAFEFQKKYQYRFSRKDIQKIIMETFPKCDYRSVNKILDYLSSLFFENSYLLSDEDQNNFIYQHRRYQEYFFILKLKEEYEKDPSILRNVNFLSNRSFIENFFIKYAREEYIKNKNIIELLALSLLDVYLGNDESFGIEDAYHWNSSDLLPALVSQNNLVFNELWSGNSCELKSYFMRERGIVGLEEEFKKWEKNKNDFSHTNNLLSMWESGMASIISNIPVFSKAGKDEIVDKLLKDLSYANGLYSKYKFFEKIDKNRYPRDPYLNNLESWIFILLNIKNYKPENIFNKLVRANYKYYKEIDRPSIDEKGKELSVKSFFRALLKTDSNKLLKTLDDIENFEFIYLLDVLRTIEFLPIFLNNKKIQNKIKKIIKERELKTTTESFFIGFFKKFSTIKISKVEEKILMDKLKEMRNVRKVDWNYKKTVEDFSILSYSLEENTFKKITKSEKEHLKHYDELSLYASLFNGYILIAIGEKKFLELIREYNIYRSLYTKRYDSFYLKYNISLIWAYIFSTQKNKKTNILISIKKNIFETKDAINVSSFAFYNSLREIDHQLFLYITNEEDIEKLASIIDDFEDYQSLVDDLFILSKLFSFFNPEKSRDLFMRGMTEGILRHGWRKDTLVSFDLVESLEIFWEKNFLSEKELIKYTEKVFLLTLKVSNFTDGKSTWQGPYNVIDILSKYNLSLAVEYKDRLIKNEGYYNFSGRVITAILFGMVQRGEIIEKIEEGMEEYQVRYDSEGKPNGDSYEQKIEVYVAIAESDFYNEENKEEAFNKAYDQVKELKRKEVYYYLNDTYFRKLKERYFILCKKYNKEPNVTIENQDTTYDYKKELEKKFVKELKSIKRPTKIKMIGMYKKLSNYKNYIILANKESWILLIDKTMEACGNVKLFTGYLEKSYFPNSDYYTSNSKYFYYGFAYILNNNKTKQEAIEYLHKNTGHKGFKSMIKVYAEIEDKEMCKNLFIRYLQLCEFLVN